MIDGDTSLDDIKDRFEAEFPPQKITLEELQQFLGMLHRSGLIIASVGGQGHELRKRRDDRRRKEILGAMTNILCLRFKGFDPERFLNWMYPYTKWLFSPVMLVLCVVLALSALTLVAVQFDVFRSKLPGFYQFFSPTNGLLLALMLGITKIMHEFGHGLSCKHFGGECHEMGIMLLVLTPCLYCNVSDSWMLPSKWKRAAIGAAGIYVEVVLASLCTFIWWFTDTGLLNNLCLNVMFISSVSTILFNANPLLRYDGYYILADLMEIPNLRQKATTILSQKTAQWFLGIEPPEDPFLPQRNQVFFALYSCAAAIYRWVVLASILWFMYQIFKPYGLQVIGQGIIAMSIVGLVGMPLYKVFKFFYVPGRVEKVKKPRMFTSLGVLAALVLAFLLIPLPHTVTCILEVQPRDAVPVYVDVVEGGQLKNVYVQAGELVKPGQDLARLENIDVDLEVARLTGSRDKYAQQLENLWRQRFRDPQAGAEIPAVEESLKTIENQLAQKRKDLARLSLRAPVAGMVLPPPAKPKQEDPEGRLADWTGTPLERENLGAYLTRGVLFCQLGDPRQMEAILIIDQADRNFVRKGQEVEIKLDELPHDTFESEVVEIANVELENAPRSLTTKAGGDLPTITDPKTGIERPQSTSYQARAPLGLYGHGTEYQWLRGRLEQSPDGETWSLRYLPGNIEADVFQGRAVLAGAGLRRYAPDDFVDARGAMRVRLTGRLTAPDTGASIDIDALAPCLAKDDQPGVSGTLLDPETGEPLVLMEKFIAEIGGAIPTGPSSRTIEVRGQLVSEELGSSIPVAGVLTWDSPRYQIESIRRLSPANVLLRQGLRGRGKIHADPIPLASRLWRFITHTFNFKI
jgi:putative peptide zinc metalloprotease protein